MTADQQQVPLRIITYLVPGLTVELFETISQYLEVSLNRETMLIYESRFTGPQSDRSDPFKTNTADLGIYIYWFHSMFTFTQSCCCSISHWCILPTAGEGK